MFEPFFSFSLKNLYKKPKSRPNPQKNVMISVFKFMKNVLFIAPTTYQLPLTENLKKKFITLSEVCNVSVLAFGNSKTFLNETYGNFYLNKKIKNRLINYFRIIQISIFTTHKIIKKENIDIVCFQDPVSSFFSILFLKFFIYFSQDF